MGCKHGYGDHWVEYDASDSGSYKLDAQNDAFEKAKKLDSAAEGVHDVVSTDPQHKVNELRAKLCEMVAVLSAKLAEAKEEFKECIPMPSNIDSKVIARILSRNFKNIRVLITFMNGYEHCYVEPRFVIVDVNSVRDSELEDLVRTYKTPIDSKKLFPSRDTIVEYIKGFADGFQYHHDGK